MSSFLTTFLQPSTVDLPELAGWHTTMVGVQLAFAVVTALVLVFISAPYGRHVRDGWGPQIPNRMGWILMESPAVLLFVYLFQQGAHAGEAVPVVLLLMWQAHYVHRTFIFPFRIRSSGKRMPLLIVALAVVFNSLNAWVNATWISHLGSYPTSWFTEPAFLIGVVVFATGMGINLWADTVLIRLRGDGSGGYQIPRGFLYDHITSPNYFGEILEWTGWAIATWSTGGLAFALYTAANLAPRAFTNRAWYRDRFPDYPPDRKALLPGIL